MHLRISTKTTAGKTYRYAQVVESYRRDDGVSTKRIVAHLGALPQPLIDSLRLAFKAASTGDTLVLRSKVAEMVSGSTLANLRYLDLAVLIECWRQWGLTALLEDLASESGTVLPFSTVILSLVLQRSCAPRSKLEATRWVPTTALPEVLGFDVATFHNSRVHRSLEKLHEVTPTLQERLAERYVDNDGAFGALFMDVTDTYFEGIGCPMAEQTRTKTQMPNRRCLGIVLLANEHGFPLRWKVVGGKTKDWAAMEGLLADIGQVDWLKDTPVVFDRAMGNQKTVATLKAAERLRFLTAAHVTAIESYTKELPYAAVCDLQIEGTDESYEQDIERVARAARKAGFDEIHSRLFAIEIGVTLPASEQEKEGDDGSPRRGRGRPAVAARHLRQARDVQRKMAADATLRLQDVAASLGITREHLGSQMALLQLAPAVQERIEQLAERFPFGEKYLRSLLSLAPNEQLAALDKELAAHLSTASDAATTDGDKPIGPLRLVAYFNPQLFVDVRRRTAGHCALLERRAKDFNVELAAAKRSRDYDSTYRRFAGEVERLKYLDTFDIELTPITVKSKTGKAIESFQGKITRDDKAWARRRRYDGFVLLLGHPDLPQTAKELVNLYRIKDTVEKDFESIKSVVNIRLRPIYSYTDIKVQAHVTLCMLALLLQRTLARRLRTAGQQLSASACIDLLGTCHLNQRRSDNEPLYDVTQPDAAQRQALVALGLEQLADDDYLRGRLTRRRLPVA